MARFLSREWMEDVNAAGGDCPGLLAAEGGNEVTIRQVVTGCPDGDVVYTLRVGGGRLVVSPDDSDAPTVTITEDLATAVALGRGELGVDEAVMAGRVRVTGDMEALVDARDLIQAALDCVASVGRRTTY